MGLITGTFLIVATIFGSVFFDVQTHDNDFSKSLTGQTLKGYGGYEYGLVAYETVLSSFKRLKENAPEYGEAVKVWSQPYVRLTRDLALTGANITAGLYNKIASFLNEQYPVAQYWVQKNLPGLRDAAYSSAATAYGVARDKSINAVQFLQKDVFVGSWSPDNMKNVTLEAYKVAFNTTQQYATQTLSWFAQTFYAPKTKN